jgi:hypothetical protein
LSLDVREAHHLLNFRLSTLESIDGGGKELGEASLVHLLKFFLSPCEFFHRLWIVLLLNVLVHFLKYFVDILCESRLAQEKRRKGEG